VLHLRSYRLPIDLFPEGAGYLEHRAEVRLLLVQSEQLRGQNVLERGHGQLQGRDLEHGRALEMLVRDRAAGGMEDHVDEDVAVPCLDKPAFRGTLEAESRGPERLLGPLDVALAYEKVDIVVGWRPASRPAGEPAAQKERHLCIPHGGCASLHGLDELEKFVAGSGGHDSSNTLLRVARIASGYSSAMTELAVAAVGDVHASEERREHLERAFEEIRHAADLVLLAGDLTTHGLVEEAVVLADACRTIEEPVLAVLGNHDHHSECADDVAAVLEDAGVKVLDTDHVVLETAEMQVGIVGTKGFVGGFPGAEIANFGERLLREVYAETSRQVEALEAGLEAIAGCERRLVLLHYAPVTDTLVGEPEGIWAFLGSGRLAGPIGAHRPEAVFHGHAHHGRPVGSIGSVPVYNVARHVIETDFALVRV